MSDSDALEPCGECVKKDEERYNPPGQPALKYRIGTHSSFMSSMISRLSKKKIDTVSGSARPPLKLTTREADDPSIALLDSWAMVADVLTFYQERIANEGYLRTATERRSVLELARAVGYELKPGVSAGTYLAFTVEDSVKTSPVLVPKGTKVQSLPAAGKLPQTFETSYDLNAWRKWNELKPLLKKPSNLKTIDEKMIDKKLIFTLNGTDLNLKPGQILLFIDSEREDNPDANSWDFRIVKSSNPDFVNNITDVELDDKSGRNISIMPSGKLEAKGTLRVYAFYLKGGLFGHNAPDWNALSPEVKKKYPGVDSNNVPEQWPLFSIEEWYHTALLASKKPDGHGLFAEYYEDVELKNLKLAKIDPCIGSSITSQEISKWLQENKPFSVRWTGRLLCTKSGKYFLIIVKLPEDGVKLWIDGKIVIDDWSHPSSQYKYAKITLIKKSTYDLKLEYYHPEMILIKNSTYDFKHEYNHPEYNAVVQLLLVPFNKINNLKLKYQHDYEKPIIEFFKSQTTEQYINYIVPENNYIVPENNLLRPIPGIYIDPYDPQIFTDSWILTVTPDMQEIFKVGNAIEHICNGFMISCQTSLVTIKQTYNTDNIFKFNDRLRDTIVYARSKSLELADDPIVYILGNVVEIEGADLDLDSGHVLFVSGIDKDGIFRQELVMLKDKPNDDGTNTTLIFNESLLYTYKRKETTIYANVVYATHGETAYDILGSGDSSIANQCFRLKKPPLTYIHAATRSGSRSELEVRIDGVLWEERPSLFDAEPTDRVYTVRFDNDGNAYLIFGDGKKGSRLTSGIENVIARYRSGIGIDGEVASETLTLLPSRPVGIKKVINPEQASGSEDPEKLDEARKNAPTTAFTMGRIVSLKDFENFVRRLAGVGKAKAEVLVVDGKNVIVVTVGSSTGKTVVTKDLETISNSVNNARDPVQQVQICSYEPADFIVTAVIKRDSTYTWQDLKGRVVEAIKSAFSFDLRDFGQAVSLSEVISVIQSVPGVKGLTQCFVGNLSMEDTISDKDAFIPALTARVESENIHGAQLLLVKVDSITIEEAKK